MKINLGAGKNILPKEEGWVNVDRANIPGIDRVMDLFKYPWDFPDNSVDEFYASHLIEHIPHEPKPSEGAVIEVAGGHYKLHPRWQELKDLDGFFCFFSEIWRIGKPLAEVKLVCPFGYSRGAFQDPTHTRYILPATFAYLTAETKYGPDFDYQVPCLFETVKVEEEFHLQSELGMTDAEYDFALGHYWDMGRNMFVTLRVIK